jgi:hypothetical protein
MPIYSYQGQEYEMQETDPVKAKEKILSYINTNTQQSQQPKERPSLVEQAVGFGSPLQRVYKGAIVDPFWGAMQLITGGKSDWVNEMAQTSERKTQEGRKNLPESFVSDKEGLDTWQLTGNLLSPVNKYLPGGGATTTEIKAAPTVTKAITEAVRPLPAYAPKVGVAAESTLANIGNVARGGITAGAIQPVTSEEEVAVEKIKNMLVGGAFGAGLASVGKAAASSYGAIAEALKPITQSGRRDILLQHLKSIIPAEKWDEVVAALKNPEVNIKGAPVTAAEAVSNIPEAAQLAAYQDLLEGTINPGKWKALRAMQNQARTGQLQSVGGTGGQDAIEQAIEQRTQATAPIREEALAAANRYGEEVPAIMENIAQAEKNKVNALQVGGKLQTEAAQQDVLSKTRPPVAGMPRVSPKYTPNFDRISENLAGAREAKNASKLAQAEKELNVAQLDSLRENGYYPLETAPIISNINKILNTPGERASDLVQSSMQGLKDKLLEFSKNGMINSHDLYMIRKEMGNTIKGYLPQAQQLSGQFDKKLVAGLEGKLQSSIDDAITGAGGSRWKEYLTTFKNESDKINQMRIGQFLQQKLGTGERSAPNLGAFVKAWEDDAATVKAATGQVKRFKEILTPSQMNTFQSVEKDVSRAMRASELSRGVSVEAPLVGREGHQLPQMLSRTAAISNTVLKALRSDANRELNAAFTQMLMNPQDLGAFMSAIPKEKAGTVVKALNNALNPENRNAFARIVAISAPSEISQQFNSEVRAKRPVNQSQQGVYTNTNPVSKVEVQGLLSSVIQQKNVPPELARVIPALVQTESGWDTNAKNKNSSAKGLFQMTNAARDEVGIPRNATVQQDIEGGIDYLLKQYRKYGDVRKALQAYNQGHYNPKSKEGKQYVATVFGNLK